MKKILQAVAVIMLSVLGTYSAINFIAGPLWAFCMIAYSVGFIRLILKDMKLDLKKIKAFTMIELIMVITIMAILLTITLGSMKADTSKAAIIQVGTTLKLYNAKAMAEQTTYRIEITAQKLEVYDIYSALVHEEDLKHAVTFDTNITNESVVINYRGELENRTSGLKLWVNKRPLRVNMFTGKVSYYQ